MAKRTRIILLVVGILALCIGLVLVAWAMFPGETLRVQATLVPTLLVPPQGAP